MKSVAIVGASLAGFRAAETFRREGFDGELHLIGDEPQQPYDRPPLSKQFLAGEWDVARIALAVPDKVDELDLTWHLGQRATALDVAAHTVTLAGGDSLTVDAVVVATGARPRTIPGPPNGVFTMRTLDDAVGLRGAFDASPEHVVVIGAGFIGAEVASTARGLGLNVTMIEMATEPFERALGADMGAVLADVHRDHDVDLRLGVGVDAILGDETVTGVRLTDGTQIAADVVVVGIGVIPNTDWLADSGLDVDDGVLCDETLLAAPGIAAAGDVARWPNPLFDEVMRVEHWDNAVSQGVHAAKRLLHGEAAGPFSAVPWFWTDQYDRKIQLAGRTTGFDSFEIVTGSVEERKFAALYGRAGRVVGVLGFNRPRHVMRYRAMVADRLSWEDALAAEV